METNATPNSTATNPLEVLVIAELDTLLATESGLLQRFAALRSDRSQPDDRIEFLGDLANAEELANRLERLLEAMSNCGYDSCADDVPNRAFCEPQLTLHQN